MNILCRLVGHRRSRRLAWASAGVWRSECLICGSRLQRIAPRKWRKIAVPKPVLWVTGRTLPATHSPRDAHPWTDTMRSELH